LRTAPTWSANNSAPARIGISGSSSTTRSGRVLVAEQVELLPGARLDFRDPFGNRVQIVQYDQVRFLKTAGVLRGMGLPVLGKTDAAMAELRSNGLA
jgi:hypothetical protein